MRIAIIGAGISGLVSAYLLAREHEVTVFEAADYIGGHTNTVTVDLGAGPVQVDTGFIVFNHRTYPNFTRLLAQLGVRSQASVMSFSVQCQRTGLEWASRSLFSQRKNLFRPTFARMLADIVRFYRRAPSVLDEPATPGAMMSVGQYVDREGLSPQFMDHFLVPLGASMWSCPPSDFSHFPIRFVVEFMQNHGMLSLVDIPTWRVIAGGSATYVKALIRPFAERIHTSCPITSLSRYPDGVEVTPAGQEPVRFDHAVIACHSDQALRMLADPSDIERELLGAMPYQTNDAILHTDTGVLPTRRSAWSSWNYQIPAESRESAILTYNMNILQTLHTPQVACVTINDDRGIDPNTIVRRIRYHHPVFTMEAPRVQAMHTRLIRHNRTSYCGAYWGYGFHEDGVRSALAVARAFGIHL